MIALALNMRLWCTIALVVICSPVFATGLSVTLVPGTTLGVPYNYTGNGNGFSMGVFEIENTDPANIVLSDITLSAVGSGDDSTAFSEVGLFIDSNTNGAYDPGIDTRYGSAYAAYPVDDGSLVFSQSETFAPSEIKRFIIVGKMDGTVIPDYQDGFRTIVSSISATGGPHSGLPTPYSDAVVIISVPTPLTLEYSVSGNGTSYDYFFRLVLDNHDGSWTPGMDWDQPYFGQAAYGSGGTTPFATWVTDAASFPVGPYWSTSWSNYTVSGMSYDCPVLIDNVFPGWEDWTPTGIGDQLVWWGTCDVFLDEGEMSWSMPRGTGGASVPGSANLEPAKRVGDWLRVETIASVVVDAGAMEIGGGDGFVIGSFDIIAHESASTLSSVSVTAGGTGDDATAFSEVGLFVDVNSNGTFDPGVDSRFGQAFYAFPADNGTRTFSDMLGFNIAETRRLFVVVKLNGPALATPGQTFNTSVTAINATGGPHSGLPSAVMPGINIVPFQMGVERGTTTVANGDTDSLGAVLPGAPLTLTYTIRNNGTTALDLTGTPLVDVTAGANVNSVSISALPAASIAPSATTTFEITCTPAAAGSFDFTVSIFSTDPDSNPYTWNVAGTQGSHDKSNENGGCSTSGDGGWWMLLALIAGGAAMIRSLLPRRRTAGAR